jgi:peptide chain release factor 1
MSDTLLVKLDQMQAQLTECDAQLADPAVNSDHTRVAELSRKRAALEPICSQYAEYQAAVAEAADLQGMLKEEDAELRQMAEAELPAMQAKAVELLDKIKGDLVTADDAAIGSVILEVRAGVGGDEAGIWAGDLVTMYERYAGASGWKWEVMDFAAAEMGGCREAVISVKGQGVWQHLGYEGGTHCVKRVPATEAQGRIHTSTATVAVLPEPEKVQIDINPDDVEIHVTTAQGPGGQNVNKVATAIKMRHKPTGIEVRMQESKSQHQNREKAWQLMRARLYELEQQKANAERGANRREMIGSGERGERIRTYRYKDNIAVDHRINQSFALQPVLAGDLEDLIHALIEHDKAERLAAL